VAQFQYRAVSPTGQASSGRVEAPDRGAALRLVRAQGVAPLEVTAAATRANAKPLRPNGRTRKAVAKLIGELAVLLNAGLSLDRALALAIDNIDDKATALEVTALLGAVKEGAPLARAMAARPGLFPPMAQAMVEAGEASGRLGDAMARLAASLERSEELRGLMITSLIYPVALFVVAVGVILMMLLFVVPQFEAMMQGAPAGAIPPASMAVMDASRFVRTWGWAMLGALVGFGLIARQLLRRPELRLTTDRLLLRVPQLGTLISFAETAQFSRTLAVLVDAGVALPTALGMAQRSLGNSWLAAAVARVANGLNEGGGLTAPLAAANVFPRLAIGFFRTGEETSQLGPMLGRLAEVLDRDVRVRLQRLIGWLTPAITVVLGAAVAGIIAAVMTAILGFNDLAVG